MRILTLNKYHQLMGGADRYAMDLAKLLMARGHEVAYAAMDLPDNLPADYPVYPIPAGVTRRNWQAVPLHTKAGTFLKGIYNVEAERAVGRAIEDFRPDVVHCHKLMYQLSPSVLRAARKRGVPVVQTMHDHQVVCASNTMYAKGTVCEECRKGLHSILKQRCYNDSLSASFLAFCAKAMQRMTGLYPGYVDRLIAPSQFLKDKVESFGWKLPPIEHVCYFLDTSGFEPNYEPGEYVLFFGTLLRYKGIYTIVRAMAQVDAPLVIAGRGIEEEGLRAEVARLGLTNVTFAGFQSGSDLHDLIRGARVVVVASECYENQPFSALESFALGKPVVGSKIAGIPELVTEETGRLFRAEDAADLAGALNGLLGDNEGLRRRGRNARRFVESVFDPEVHLTKLEGVYDRAGAAAG